MTFWHVAEVAAITVLAVLGLLWLGGAAVLLARRKRTVAPPRITVTPAADGSITCTCEWCQKLPAEVFCTFHHLKLCPHCAVNHHRRGDCDYINLPKTVAEVKGAPCPKA